MKRIACFRKLFKAKELMSKNVGIYLIKQRFIDNRLDFKMYTNFL